MPETKEYDAIVIGSGQGGKPLAIALATAGWRTAIIEREHIGGTCINVGCTPTKTMYNSARVAYLTRRSAEYGVHAGPVTVNMAEVRARKQGVVDSFREGGLKALERTPGLDLLFGEASFTGQHSMEVRMNEGGNCLLTAGKIFINTGGRPSTPDVEGLDGVPHLDSSSIMELDEVPEHLLVMGGGYIGLEFGQMFRRYGSRVTIVHRGERLLAREDPDVADEIAKILTEDGITVLLNSEITRVYRTSDQPRDESRFWAVTAESNVARATPPDREKSAGQIVGTVRTPGGEQTLTGSHLLVAVGRTPNTERLNLQTAGVQTNERGSVKVNDRLETNVSGVYALGDVNGGPQFTHISYDDFRIIRANLIEGGAATTRERLVPYTVFMDPQLGRVGLTETDAKGRGLDVRVARLPMAHVARAIEMSETRGLIKAVVDAGTNQILGSAVLGVEGGELMAMLQIAMMGGVPYTLLKDAIFAHPTMAEALNNLFMAMDA
ncbi:MAG TPA: mercuric reductase [Blastocatellia bacterium]|nr:mercuric reductase [Blastocatellia bacterium]